jgi:hypothetical protein
MIGWWIILCVDYPNPKNFMDSMYSIGRAHRMRPYPMEHIGLTPEISCYRLEKLEHRVKPPWFFHPLSNNAKDRSDGESRPLHCGWV